MVWVDDHFIRRGTSLIAGVDEAGRGAWAGPLVAAAVIMPRLRIAGVNDSKQLTARQREQLYQGIIEQAISWSVVSIGIDQIDTLGVHAANLFALSYVLTHLAVMPDLALVDGFTVAHYLPTKRLIHGDQLSYAIAAASIVAKVVRDQMMQQLDHADDRYGFAQHKGYGTRQHQQALQQHGVSLWHRRSFAPIRALTI
ncbi:MAG: ribonuclease HII [Candidatus Kerfeldbacteria bacterium]|nr:ribonuclease HII [Candidatus Kerfeldbacteria bacterium]